MGTWITNPDRFPDDFMFELTRDERSVGVMEGWSVGYQPCQPNTPSLQYSNTPILHPPPPKKTAADSRPPLRMCMGLFRLVVLAKFNLAAVLPGERDAIRGRNFQPARHEAGIAVFFLGHLAFARAGPHVGPERHRTAGHVLVPRNLHCDDFLAELCNLDDLIEVASIMANPLASEVDARGRNLCCLCCLWH